MDLESFIFQIMMTNIADTVASLLNDVLSCQEFENVDIKIRQQIQHLFLLIDLLIRNPETGKFQFILEEHAKVKVSS